MIGALPGKDELSSFGTLRRVADEALLLAAFAVAFFTMIKAAEQLGVRVVET